MIGNAGPFTAETLRSAIITATSTGKRVYVSGAIGWVAMDQYFFPKTGRFQTTGVR
jgi:hypothetical protein